MGDAEYIKAFEGYIKDHRRVLQQYEKKIENDEKRYSQNASLFIEQIGKKETVVEKLKSEFEKLKSEFKHIGHRDTYRKETQAVNEAFQKRDRERVAEFEEMAEQLKKRVPRIQEFRDLYTLGGKFLSMKESYEGDMDIRSDIERIFKDTISVFFSRIAQLNTAHPAKVMLSAAFGDRY